MERQSSIATSACLKWLCPWRTVTSSIDLTSEWKYLVKSKKFNNSIPESRLSNLDWIWGLSALGLESMDYRNNWFSFVFNFGFKIILLLGWLNWFESSNSRSSIQRICKVSQQTIWRDLKTNQLSVLPHFCLGLLVFICLLNQISVEKRGWCKPGLVTGSVINWSQVLVALDKLNRHWCLRSFHRLKRFQFLIECYADWHGNFVGNIWIWLTCDGWISSLWLLTQSSFLNLILELGSQLLRSSDNSVLKWRGEPTLRSIHLGRIIGQIKLEMPVSRSQIDRLFLLWFVAFDRNGLNFMVKAIL